ncbi:MAG: DNA polymerase III subunit delta [Pseudomonadota bacterium]
MTALKGRAIDAFVEKRDPTVAAVLIYGPDEGLVRERADALARQVVDDFKDPFNYIELTDADIKAEPARLADEAAALSFAGGERLVRIRTTGDAAAKAAAALVDGLEAGSVQANALTLVEAGDLKKTSSLRKLFERSKRVAALPCYIDGEADRRALVEKAAQDAGLAFAPDALAAFTAGLADDRGVARAEIDKLLMYKGDDAERTLTLQDVRAVSADGASDATDEAAAACGDGDAAALSRALHRTAVAGGSPIAVLRAVQRQIGRLHDARRLVDAGHTVRDAMTKVKPPVFFVEQRAFARRLDVWNTARLARATDGLVRAELEAKTTGAPQREIVERACLRVAAMAGKRR